MGPNNQQSNFKFSFHHVLHNSAQETVYDSLARDVVQGVADGVNGKYGMLFFNDPLLSPPHPNLFHILFVLFDLYVFPCSDC